jgi:hypothetical protein
VSPQEVRGERLRRLLRGPVPLTLWWVLALSVSLVIALALPWHMDEFVMYKAYSCWSPLQQWNVYAESCTSYATSLGPVDFFRSYRYIGITSSLLITPFAALLPFTWMPAVLGIAFLALGAWGLQRGFRLPPAAIPALMLVFPIAFAVIRDSGPVRLSFVALCWSPVIVAAFLRTGHWRWVAALAALWTVSAEDKPFFMYVVPGIAIFAVAGCVRQGLLPRNMRTWVRLIAAFGLSGLLAAGLLVALQVPSGSYLSYLANETPGRDPSTLLPGVVSGLFLLFDWAYSGHRITYNSLSNVASDTFLESITNRLPDLRSPRWIAGTFFTALSIAAPVGLLALALRWRSRINACVLTCLAAALVLFVGTVMAGGWAMHHFVYAQVPIAVAGAIILSGTAPRAVAVLLTGGALAAVLAIIAIPTTPYAGYEANRAVNVALSNADANTIVNCSDWGCYFPGAFTARDTVPVVIAETPEFAAQLEQRAQEEGRVVMHVCAFCTEEQVQARFPNSRIMGVYTEGQYWRVFRVEPEAP